jgi:hypothetical protein
MHECTAAAWFHVRTATLELMACSRAPDTTLQQQRQHDCIRDIIRVSSRKFVREEGVVDAGAEIKEGDADE